MDLVIPDSIDSIGDYCFVNCGIKTLTLSDSVKQIGYGSFCYNSTLQQADLGNGIEKIGRSAFYGCNNLADIQIGDQVRYMGADALEETAFYAESTNWENNILYLGTTAVQASMEVAQDCSLRAGTKSIAERAFVNTCSGDYWEPETFQISLPESLEYINDEAFYYSKLTAVSAGDQITYIGENAFTRTPFYNSGSNWNNGVLYLKGRQVQYLISANSLSNTTYEIEPNTKTIAYGAFSFREQLQQVTIPQSVSNINDCAFQVTGLQEVEIPDSVTEICYSTFAKCRALRHVDFSDELIDIDRQAFYECRSLQEIELPDTVHTIGQQSFYWCYQLTTATFSSSLQTIGDAAFSYCRILQDVELKDNVKSIGDLCFDHCESISSVCMTDSVCQLGKEAFEYNYCLTNLTLSNAVTTIPEGCFSGCSSLTDFAWPKQLERIEQKAFLSCQSLRNLVIPDTVEYLGRYAFLNCSPTTLEIGSGIREINFSTFSGCGEIQRIVIPSNVRKICAYAFERCSPQEIILDRDGLREIGSFAFTPAYYGSSEHPQYISELKQIILPDSVLNIGSGVFEHFDSLEFLHIPPGTTSIGEDVLYDTHAYICSPTTDCYAKTYADLHSIEFRLCTGSHVDSSCTHPTYTSEETTPATCQTEGTMTYTCTVCGYSYTEVIQKTDHIPQDVTEPEPTCTEEGKQFTNCAVCGKVLSSVTTLPALGHSYDADVTKEATCQEKGVITYTCSRCGFSYTDTIEKKPHTTKAIHIEPSCSESGMIVTICEVCNEVLDKTIIPSLGHIRKTERVEPTCTQNGREYTICQRCGMILGDATELPALGHNYDSGVVTTKATCIAEGVMTYTCTRAGCGQSYSQTIPKEPHTETVVRIEPTCLSVGAEYTVCAVCGIPLSDVTVLDPLGHNFDAVVTKEATCWEEGVITYTCVRSGCGFSYSDTIDKKQHIPQQVTEQATCQTEGRQYTKCSVCGTILSEITVLPIFPHSFSAWVTVMEATVDAEGMKERVCIWCGFRETEVIPKIPTKTVTDEKSGVSVTYPDGVYDGEVELKVEQVFDGAAFNLVDRNSAQNMVFDITTTKPDGTVVQPKGKLTVRIPVPAGFDPALCVIYHISTETNKIEQIPARYEDGCMVFETDHFSYYAIAIVSQVISIRNYVSSVSVDYRTTITFSTNPVLNPVSGAQIHWFINGQDKGTGDTYTENEAKATYTVQAKYMKNGYVIMQSKIETVHVKTGFFARLIAFFRSLFNKLPKTFQEYLGIEIIDRVLP